MKTQSLLGFIALFVIFVHLSNGSVIPQEEEEVEPNEKSTTEIKPIKKILQLQKKKSPPLYEKRVKKGPKNKLKISDLRPCISKAFCEVNSITEEPTYETTKEFYHILNRLKKFIDIEQRDDNGSGSAEDSGSSEESNENVPDHRPGNYYRHGKSLDDIDLKLKKKTKKKFKKSKNGTELGTTKPAKVYTPAQLEQRAFVDRKKQELNVVDDLAALIKISAEIGQALKSPRRCRSLFKKCAMSYDQIIRIFNRTQSVESSDPVPLNPPSTTPIEPFLVDFSAAAASNNNDDSPSSIPAEQATKVVEQEDDNVSDGDRNRNKKSRTDFSEEDLDEYNTDSDLEPVKTYSLFSSPQIDKNNNDDADTANREREDAIVDEAFQKFEKVFPSTAGKSKYNKKQESTISNKVRQPVRQQPASSEEEESNESFSGSAERPNNQQQSDYAHRSSSEIDNQDTEEVEMEVPEKKVKTKPSSQVVKENAEIAGEVDETEDDSDAEIPSSEIGKKPEDETAIVNKPAGVEIESSSEEASEEDHPKKNNNKIQNVQAELYTRDDENDGFNTYGFYPQVRPTFTKPITKSVKSKGKKRKGNKKGQKGEKPQNDQNSSEEERPDAEKFMPPHGSQFYQALQQVNDGKGGDVIPGKSYNKNKKSKRKQIGSEPERYQDYDGKPGYSNYGGEGQQEYGGYGPPQTEDQGPPSIFQSIMGWFSRGSKSTQGVDEGQYQGGGSYFGGNKEHQPYREPYSNKPGKYPSSGSGQDGQDGYGPGRYPSREPHSANNDRYPSPSRQPTRGRYPQPPRPQGRGDESSEEEEEDEEEEDDHQVQPSKREVQHQKRRHPSQSSKSHDLSSSLTVSGPPPPLVIVPHGQEPDYPLSQRNPTKNSSTKSKQQQKPKQKEENSDESKETSSEEVQPKSKSQSKKSPHKKQSKPDDDKIFSGIFASAAEIDKQNVREKEHDDRENASLLLSTFDSITNTFSTSADKITDWSEEDNPKKKINVASLASNQQKGKYRVNKNKTKHTNLPVSLEVDKNESEEEEEDK